MSKSEVQTEPSAPSGPRVLVIGFGNPGRCDDGLGPALADLVAAEHLPNVSVDSDYQLQVEDADSVSRHDVVVFVDAAVSGAEPFEVREVQPDGGMAFSSHSLSPAEVLGLTHRLFGSKTRGFLVGIRGYEFNEFGERLSAAARENLAHCHSFLRQALCRGALEQLDGWTRSASAMSHRTE